MLLTLGNNLYIRCYVLSWALLNTAVGAQLFDGDDCIMKDRTPGICRPASNCVILEEAIKCGKISVDDPVRCGFLKAEEVICCPKDGFSTYGCNTSGSSRRNNAGVSNNFSGSSTFRPPPSGLRPAVTACRRIEELLSTALVPNILDGNETALGEFPHMAAIGFVPSDDEKSENYNFRCGGTLIDKRFVLSAAHCFRFRGVAKVVRLGFVDFTDKEQLDNAVTVRIKKIYIHPDYNILMKYNDIALLQLENDIDMTADIAPTCLYTDAADPPKQFGLYATGWGITELKTRSTSKILLKAKLEISPLQTCNATYISNGEKRGLIESQMCAFDPGKTSDTCQGDSGGPLNMVLDQDKRQYRVVGITSVGFGCGSDIPSLYTRVSAHLDFIENVVWPDL